MSALSIRCIKAAFAYLAVGIALGAVFGLDRSLGSVWRPLHAEFNLWGWVTLLIYGMAYHILPRISGYLLRWPRLAHAQSWLAIGGVLLTGLGWTAAVSPLSRFPLSALLLAAGGLLQIVAALLFIVQIGDLLRSTR